MTTFTNFINIFSGSAVLGLQLSIVFILGWFVFSGRESRKKLTDFFSKWALWLVFAVTGSSTLMSLVYSDIIGYEPCKLCWFQRIFMYPLAIIFGLAAFGKPNKDIRKYGLVFSGIGSLIALYHYLLELGLVPSGFCAVSAVDCSRVYVMMFGYVTIPMMTLTVFVFVFILSLLNNRKD